MERKREIFQPTNFLILFFGLFLIFAFLEKLHRFHYKRLFSPSPYGYIIGREGKIPSMSEEEIIFKKVFPLNKKKELRFWFWGKDKGILYLNGDLIFEWDKPEVYFLRISKEKLKEKNVFEAKIYSKIGFSTLWLSDISGLGTDKSWECYFKGEKIKTRVFGKPPMSLIFPK